MKTNIIITFMGIMYNMILRDLLVKAIEDPNEEWDDLVLIICDRVFGYSSDTTPLYEPKINPEG